MRSTEPSVTVAELHAVLLATGEHRRLGPLSEALAPALVPVGHQPVMAHMLEMLAAQDVRRMVVCLHDQPASIEGYFGRGQRWGVTLDYSVQRQALGTAGALKRAGRLAQRTLLVAPAESLADADLAAALHHHRQQGNLVTILAPARPAPGPSGLAHGAHASAAEFGSARPAELADCAGLYLLEPEVLDLIPAATPFDIQHELIPALVAAGAAVGVFPALTYWNALASLADYWAGQQAFLDHLSADAQAPRHNFPNPASLRGRSLRSGVWVGRNSNIHPSARLAAPVFIGANCRIGPRVELGPGVVLGANVIVDEEATVRQSVIMDDTYVGKLVNLERRVAHKNLLVDLDSGACVSVADTFWLGETHTSVDQSVARQVWDRLVAGLTLAVLAPLAALWALALWLAAGRVFVSVTYVQPAHPAETRTVLNFYAGERNGLAAWLSRWQARLEWQRLPELMSVVAGRLRLVGVKPLTPQEAAAAAQAGPLGRQAGEPGFTGLWYVQTEPESDLDTVLVADAYYAATRDWRGDLSILAQTPVAWLRRRQPAAQRSAA